ncbi:MAG: type II secretion system protein [Clostridiales bacterium]|nr:type II secretion system protein [Clostridiales bacterium]
MKKLMKNRKGFTLIELIVVIAILGILAAILIPQFSGFQKKAKSSQVMVDARQIATAADALLIEKGEAPNEVQIKEVAGSEITGVISGISESSSGGHVLFTYKREIDEVEYVAKRAEESGEITLKVSYS